MSDKLFFKGTLILTLTGIASRIMGFFYRIFLSHTIGAQGVGIYQLTLPVQGIILAAAATGIQAALSRLCASFTALEKEKETRSTLLLGMLLSFFISLFLSAGVYLNADFIAKELLKEARAVALLRILSFSFPLSALHSCVNSFYYARKKAGLPAFIQLLEQTSRIGSTYIIYQIFLSEGKEISPVIAAGGALFCEIVSVAACFLALGVDFSRENYRPLSEFRDRLKIPDSFSVFLSPLGEIAKIAVPHSANRLLLTVLSGIEMLLIPQQLLLWGVNKADALTIYGIFTGMALPLILFPATITNSAAVMLMPQVAGLQALGYEKRIRHVIRSTLKTCFFFGTFCTLFFFLFGKPLGFFLFRSETAGIYIKTLAFICPFLYTNTALESILNGLGKPDVCLFHNVAGICIRIAFVILSIPHMGIRGCFYGMLISQLILTLLHLIYLNRLNLRT